MISHVVGSASHLTGWWGGFVVGATVVLVLLSAAYEWERRHRKTVVFGITFDQDTFGLFTTREAAERDLERQSAEGGPAWEDCQVTRMHVHD